MTATVLAVLPNWLGDLVMAEPALRALSDRARLVGVVSPALFALAEDAQLCAEWEVFDRRGRDAGLLGLWRAGRRLRRVRADGAVVFGPSLRAAALAFLSRARVRRGFGGEGRELFLDDVMRRPGRSVHLVDAWLELVGARPGDRPRWSIGPKGREGITALRAEGVLPPDYVALAPSAAFGPAKQWPLERFVATARALTRATGLPCVFVGGPSAAERERGAAMAAAADGIDLTGRTDLPTLAAVLAEARAFVGNDSGPMHLAAACGTPTVGIFGSTSPAWTAPRGLRAQHVGPGEVECTPCFQRTCRFDLECLRAVEVETVVETTLRVMTEVAA